jgi:hypothetical protein
MYAKAESFRTSGGRAAIFSQRGPAAATKRIVMLSEAKHLLVSLIRCEKQILRCAQNDSFKIFAPREELAD